ncbi:ATP-binding cassette domain-containing protein [Pseudomonas sp. Z1-14]|uniref:ATP-binding cassette domain-containing protein n=1 Tax=Pseudomonas sp. Z1-14 TaxID=2817409 RepID=UPI003DA96552
MRGYPEVSINGLSKAFDGIEVLKNETWCAKTRVVSVLGTSGSGKSTMLRCINWLEVPDSGTIGIGGQRIGVTDSDKPMSLRELATIRARTAMVFQNLGYGLTSQ